MPESFQNLYNKYLNLNVMKSGLFPRMPLDYEIVFLWTFENQTVFVLNSCYSGCFLLSDLAPGGTPGLLNLAFKTEPSLILDERLNTYNDC